MKDTTSSCKPMVKDMETRQLINITFKKSSKTFCTYCEFIIFSCAKMLIDFLGKTEIFSIFLTFDFCQVCVVIHFFHLRHKGQWPPTLKDFLSQILSITLFSYLNSWESQWQDWITNTSINAYLIYKEIHKFSTDCQWKRL